MRILYIVTAYPRRPGDIITPWLLETIRRLSDRGVEVEVLAPSYRGLGDHSTDGVRVHRFRYAPSRFETLTHDQTAPDRIRERPWYIALLPGYLLAGTLAALRLAGSGRFDCVHAFWPLPHGLFGVAVRNRYRIPLVCTFFGVELRLLRGRLGPLRPVVRWIVRRSDVVTAISSHTEAELRNLVPDATVRRIPFGSAVTAGDAEADDPISRAAAKDFHLLFVGRLVERKGVSVLLRGLARIPESSAVRLTVVGDGPLRDRLEAEATALGLSERVEFSGFVPEDELANRLRSCDALVLPAVEDRKGDVEGLGVVLLEAMQYGRPVIASRSGGIPDIVVDGVTGLSVPPGDADALAAAIERLRSDADLRHRLVEGAHRHLATHFSWRGITDDLVGLYAELIGRETSDAARGRSGR